MGKTYRNAEPLRNKYDNIMKRKKQKVSRLRKNVIYKKNSSTTSKKHHVAKNRSVSNTISEDGSSMKRPWLLNNVRAHIVIHK